jgi:hypothetical protein
MTRNEFRTKAFADIDSIIESSNAHSFEILGWKYIGIRLILTYHDCRQVFDFDFIQSDDGGELKMTKFFTKDFTLEERSEAMKAFDKIYNRDLPE